MPTISELAAALKDAPLSPFARRGNVGLAFVKTEALPEVLWDIEGRRSRSRHRDANKEQRRYLRSRTPKGSENGHVSY